MSLYAIADLHLSLDGKKPMDVFEGWENYQQKIETNWKNNIEEDDVVVIAGDLCWGMNLEEAKQDFLFVNNLPGKKILLKGNHDYYFSTKAKIERFFKENQIESISILHNNSYIYKEYSICGTRGWINEPGQDADIKVLKREALRMKLSLDSAKNKPIVFTHYPPICGQNESIEMIEVLKEYNIDKLYYGHLHGKSCKYAYEGERDGIKYKLISADHLNFTPFKILN